MSNTCTYVNRLQLISDIPFFFSLQNLIWICEILPEIRPEQLKTLLIFGMNEDVFEEKDDHNETLLMHAIRNDYNEGLRALLELDIPVPDDLDCIEWPEEFHWFDASDEVKALVRQHKEKTVRSTKVFLCIFLHEKLLQPERRRREKNESLEQYKIQLGERLFVSDIDIFVTVSIITFCSIGICTSGNTGYMHCTGIVFDTGV